MTRSFAAVALSALTLAATPALAQSPEVVAQAVQLRDRALADNAGYEIVSDLTTRFGPRLAGSPSEQASAAWGAELFRELGFTNVEVESFPLAYWERGTATAEILAPFPQPLVVVALGGSPATPRGGIEGEVVVFDTFQQLLDAPMGSLNGKIAMVLQDTVQAQDGRGYGATSPIRGRGPIEAGRRGAVAFVLRSLGTHDHRFAHAGATTVGEGQVPAFAMSPPDADQVRRIVARSDQPIRLRLTSTSGYGRESKSQNVIGEVVGTNPDEVIVIGGHLDSWDLGTGAFDDATGCGIVAAAAKRIMDVGTPRRTIRILWAGAEEVGVFGGRAYFDAHKGEHHALAAESDFGADRIWRVDFKLPDSAKAVGDRVAAALAPLGISRGRTPAGGGADIAALVASGVAGIDLQQDGSRYFDLHHTPDDTLDKVDPAQLRQNVAAWTAMLAVVANAPEEIGPVK